MEERQFLFCQTCAPKGAEKKSHLVLLHDGADESRLHGFAGVDCILDSLIEHGRLTVGDGLCARSERNNQSVLQGRSADKRR
jgi:hypothetical protein